MAKRRKPAAKKPTAFVLDGSVALAWCFVDETDSYADDVARRLPDVEAVVPAIWHLEVGNALLVGERRGRCTQGDTANWTAFLASLAIAVDHPNGPRDFAAVVSLAREHNLTTYDAAYLELALRRGVPIATLDRKLRAAATAVGVKLF